MRDRSKTVPAAVAGLIVAFLVWGPWPLGVPSEWTWVTIPGSAVTLVAALGLALVGALLIVIVDKSATFYETRGPWSRSLMAAAMVSLIFSWMNVVREPLDWMKTAAGRTRDPWVLYSPGISGYFSKAREIDSTTTFLANYETTVAEGDYLHQGTHPPGLILCYRGLYTACDLVPSLTVVADEMMSEPVRESFAVISETQLPSLTPTDRAVIWWASVLTQLALAGTCVPILGLLGNLVSSSDAWRIASLWAFVPAGVIFLPKSDCFYPFIATSVLWLWVLAMQGRRITAVAVGLLASAGLWLSLALAPFYAGIGVGSIWRTAQRSRANRSSDDDHAWRNLASATGLAIAGGFVPIIVAAALGMNIVNVWLGNLRNHAAFYEHNTRTFIAWLPTNILEALIAAGPPIVLVAVLSVLARFFRNKHPSDNTDTIVDCAVNGRQTALLIQSLVVGVSLAWCALWLSGKNMGEAARLWVLFTPIPLLALGLGDICDGSTKWRVIAFSSLIALLVVSLRIDGFDLGGRAIGL